MKALLIHGAGASPLSWRTFRSLTGLETRTFSYDVHRPFESIVGDCLDEIDRFGAQAVVGHSFGGVVAWNAADAHPGIETGVSISSPWGGSAYCDVIESLTLGMLPVRFFTNMSRMGAHLTAPRTRPARVPWMNVVTTRSVVPGGPPNDGVVTVVSQDSLFMGDNVLRVEFHYNHSEVLQTDELAQTVDAFLDRSTVGMRRRRGPAIS